MDSPNREFKVHEKVDLQVRQCLMCYGNNCTIHGIKYVFAEDKNIFTRIFWGLAVLFAISFSGYFLINSFIKWHYTPDIGTRREIINARKLPFPAITICPQTKTKIEFLSFRSTYKNYWDHFKLYGVSEVDAARFESMLHVCQQDLSFRIQLNESRVNDGHDIVKTLKEISYSVQDSMMICKFRDVLRNCSALFNEVVTNNGICYSFNMLNYDELFNPESLHKDFDSYYHSKTSSWSLDGGYQSDDLNAYPYPILSQHHDALRIILKTNDVDLDYICHGSNQGFLVFFHLPGDFASITGKHLFIPIRHEVNIAMSGKLTKISESLKNYRPSQRKCYLTNEKPLQFFKQYSQNACNLECFANYTMNKCGCVKFSMPRRPDTKICDYSMLNCTMNAKREMMLAYNMVAMGELSCDCLPSCTEIVYSWDHAQTDFDFKKLFESYRYDLSDSPGAIMSRLTIFFQDPLLESTERYPLFTFSDYIAQCGGVLGLFMGFSILSFIELLYYLICWILRVKCRRIIY